MESVANNETKYGVVPIENSIEGPVGITLDFLAHKFNLKIFKEIIIPINQNLIVNPGVKIEDGAVVGAASVVTKNVAKNTVVVGSPARVVRCIEC